MLLRTLHSARDGLLGLAYPEVCRVCGAPVESWDDGVACAGCWNDPDITPLLDGGVCAKCGSPAAKGLPSAQSDSSSVTSKLCGLCSDLPFDVARACGIYSGALETNILFLKVNPHICTRLRSLITRTYSRHREALDSDLVVPVPLHRLRERERGFNQATIVARIISREFDLPVADRLLARTKQTERHRAGLDAVDRGRSVAQAFAVSAPLKHQPTILLVDDVYTTGSTICSAARCLIEAGAGRVNVLTLARVG